MSKHFTTATRSLGPALAVVAFAIVLALGAFSSAQASAGHHGHHHHDRGHHTSNETPTHHHSASHGREVVGKTEQTGRVKPFVSLPVGLVQQPRSHCPVGLTETHCEICLDQVALRVVQQRERFTVAHRNSKTATLLPATVAKSAQHKMALSSQRPPPPTRLEQTSRPVDLQNRFRI